jgi:hypothetical protein
MSTFPGRSASARGSVTAVVRLLAAVLLLSMGRASVAVALGCPDDSVPVGTAGIAVIAPAASTPDGSTQGAEAGACLCACGCAQAQVAAIAAAEPIRPDALAGDRAEDLPEHAPPTPVLPLRLRPPLA